MQLKTLTRNGVTISYPAGYAKAQDYLATLRVNLGILRRTGRSAHLIPGYVAAIAAAEKALA